MLHFMMMLYMLFLQANAHNALSMNEMRRKPEHAVTRYKMISLKKMSVIVLMLPLMLGYVSCGDESSSLLSSAPEPSVPSFTEQADYPSGEFSYDIVSSDLDSDGDDDLIVVNSMSSFISIFLNNGDAVFQIAGQYSVGRWPESVCASDLDGDGNIDLVAASRHGNTISVLLNNGDATFQPAIDYEGVSGGIYGTSGCEVIASDLDGDGDNDLACTNVHLASISIYMNNGDGTFPGFVQYAVGNHPGSLCASDLDADGDSDLVVANRYSNNLSVLLNNGDGTFGAAVSYGSVLWKLLFVRLGSVISCDLDGDGDNDIAVAGEGGINASIILNNGDGTFSSAVIYYETSDGLSSLYASDLDGDGDNDLVVANESSGNVSVLLNDGNAVFEIIGDYPVGQRPLSIITPDLDGDGDKDLAVVNYSSDNITVLLNSTND